MAPPQVVFYNISKKSFEGVLCGAKTYWILPASPWNPQPSSRYGWSRSMISSWKIGKQVCLKLPVPEGLDWPPQLPIIYMVGRLRRKIIGFLSLCWLVLLGFIGLMSMQSLGKEAYTAHVVMSWLNSYGTRCAMEAAVVVFVSSKVTLQLGYTIRQIRSFLSFEIESYKIGEYLVFIYWHVYRDFSPSICV